MNTLASLWLVAARMGGAVSAAPLFTSAPAWGRLALTLLLAVLVLPGAQAAGALPDIGPSDGLWWGMLAAEVVTGLLMGFVLRIMLAGVQFGGALVDVQMGISMVSFMDPHEQVSTTLVSQLWHAVTLAVIFTTNVHHLVLEALVHSYRLLPVGSWQSGGLLLTAQMAASLFGIGLLLALPIVAMVLITDLLLGVMTKSAPQINIFSVGIPLKVLLTLVLLVIVFPYVVTVISSLGDQMVRDLETLMRVMAPAG